VYAQTWGREGRERQIVQPRMVLEVRIHESDTGVAPSRGEVGRADAA
jgi:hypothetical protein